jgi:DNA-binding MarR family transcriptional regulator
VTKVDHILVWLEQASAPVRASTLAAALAFDCSAVSARLSALVALGLARAQPDPQRKTRGRFYTITDAGRMRVICSSPGRRPA